MQLIRAINKSNKSNNNNNQTSSGSNSKVVIVAPPATHSSVSQSRPSQPSQAPVSPSVALPALKKRTTIVKQSVPPPVPPRGSPRSKSKSISVTSGRKSTIDGRRLASLSSLEQSGCQKVEKWLQTVEITAISVPEDLQFKSVRKLAEKFAPHHDSLLKSIKTHRKVSDSSLVRQRIENYDSLASGRMRHLMSSDTGTDSGIDIPTRFASRPCHKLLRTADRFRHDEEFV